MRATREPGYVGRLTGAGRRVDVKPPRTDQGPEGVHALGAFVLEWKLLPGPPHLAHPPEVARQHRQADGHQGQEQHGADEGVADLLHLLEPRATNQYPSAALA